MMKRKEVSKMLEEITDSNGLMLAPYVLSAVEDLILAAYEDGYEEGNYKGMKTGVELACDIWERKK